MLNMQIIIYHKHNLLTHPEKVALEVTIVWSNA